MVHSRNYSEEEGDIAAGVGARIDFPARLGFCICLHENSIERLGTLE